MKNKQHVEKQRRQNDNRTSNALIVHGLLWLKIISKVMKIYGIKLQI